MKKMFPIILATAILALSSGCTIMPKGDALHKAANQETFKGLDKNTKFSYSVPNDHSGPYSSIDQFNVIIDEGLYKDKNASAFIGKSRRTKKWEVFSVMMEENGNWIKLSEKMVTD